MTLGLDLGLNFILPGPNIYSLPRPFRPHTLDGNDVPWHKEYAEKSAFDVNVLHGHWHQKSFE